MKCLRQGGALSAIMMIVCSFTAAARSADAQTLPSGWTSQDIGTATGGSATGDSTSITVRGSGDNIWGTADGFRYAYRSLSGDFTITARVSAFSPANEWAKAGLMVREAATASARNVYVLLSPGLGHALQTRAVAGGTTARVTGTLTGSPTWLRLTRRGSTFAGYASRDGSAWTLVSSSTISLATTVQVGLAVTSRDAGAVEEAVFTNISIQQTAATDSATSTIWSHRDIGSPALSGSWTLSGGTHTVTAAGTDIWSSADQFHFVYQLVSGDVDIVARVASLQNTNAWAKAGIMIRESLTAGSRHHSLFATPSNGWPYQYRSVAGSTSFSESGPAGQPPGWVRLTRAANVVKAYTSPDGQNWTIESTQTVTLPTSVYVGLAVTSHNASQRTTATFSNVTVGRPSSGGNQAPTVSFSSPANGATFTAPARIYVNASATDADGTIARVDLYQGTRLLKADSTNPFSYSWTNVAAGTYQLRAVAYDNAGSTQTATVSVTVNAAGNQLPAVSITSPANNASFTAPANVTIQAAASDADGTISRVEFYRGTTLVGSDTTSPYSATWSSAPSGSYTLTARAFDNAGAATTSSPVNINVGSSSNQLPTVSITSPASGATFTAPASLTIAANAADGDGTIARVDFYAGTQLIATDTSSPYTASWTNVAAGSYSLTAVARDNAGGARTSAAVSITVGSSTTRPTSVSFDASTNHDTAVTSYVVALYRSIDPVTASPVATRDIGKPTPVSGVITSDISVTVNALPSGSYYSVVTAVGGGGSAASTPSATFTK